ncbi:MAG: hypothetical protein ACXWUG_00345 [Polyangiales bacterium]
MKVEGLLVTHSPRRSRMVLRGAIASMVVFGVLASETRALIAAIGIALSLGVACFAALTEKLDPSAPRRAAIEVLDGEVEIDGKRMKKSAIVSAHREDDLARIELSDGTRHDLRASVGEIESLIEALGFGPGRRVQRFVVGGYGSPATQRLAIVATMVVVTMAAPLLAGFLFSVILALFAHREDEVTAALVLGLPAILTSALAFKLWRAIRRVPIYVGGDAVRIAGRSHSIDRLELQREGRELRIVSGVDRVRVTCASDREAATLATAIDEARLGLSPAEIDTAPLVRGGDAPEAWKSRLVTLLDASAYRATIGADDLARVVEDASASAEVRVAAALALSSLGDDAPERARVRFAIEAVASPKLRIALERADSGELDAEAIEELARDRE